MASFDLTVLALAAMFAFLNAQESAQFLGRIGTEDPMYRFVRR